MSQTIANSHGYSKAFWVCYFLCAVFSGFAILTYILHGYALDPMNGASLVSVATSRFVFQRIVFIMALAAGSITLLVLLKSQYLDKLLLFIAVWMWVVFIDDNLVLDQVLIIPDNLAAEFIMSFRPFILLATSWMAIEAAVKSRRNFVTSPKKTEQPHVSIMEP